MTGAALDTSSVPFPSLEWFRRLGELMNASRARHEHLGYVDCVVQFTVTDGPGGRPWGAQVTFEEFSATDVRPVGGENKGRADFRLEARAATWREMIESIARGNGRPDVDHTLNRLSHFGTPMRVVSDDVLKTDLYFRYNQSLQEFVNASSAFRTTFDEG
jgi:hypothetical protein